MPAGAWLRQACVPRRAATRTQHQTCSPARRPCWTSLRSPGATFLQSSGLVVWRGGDLQLVEDTFGQALEAAVSEHDQRAQLRGAPGSSGISGSSGARGRRRRGFSLAAEAMPALEQLRDDRTLGRVWYVLAHVHGGFRCRYRESAEAAERALHYFRRSNWPVAPLPAGARREASYCGPTSVEQGNSSLPGLCSTRADRGGEANILVFLGRSRGHGRAFDSARDLVWAGAEDLRGA